MSRYFPHASYAEDQRLPKTILTTHVVTRAITLNVALASGIVAVRHFVTKLGPRIEKPFVFKLARASGRATAAAVGVGVLLTTSRMYGKDDIEWRDRSWRLMENQGQIVTDDWTYTGMIIGGVLGSIKGTGLRHVVGGMGLGSLAGIIRYLGWRCSDHKEGNGALKGRL